MTKWGVTEIVCKTDSLDQIRIDEKVFVKSRGGLLQKRRDRAADLGDFERMSQPGAVKVEFTRKKNLGLGLQPAKSRAVNDSVSVSLKSRSILVWFAPSEAFCIELVVKSIFGWVSHQRLF
jgi:hypothetical protein